jgi:hypothetical protein
MPGASLSAAADPKYVLLSFVSHLLPGGISRRGPNWRFGARSIKKSDLLALAQMALIIEDAAIVHKLISAQLPHVRTLPNVC